MASIKKRPEGRWRARYRDPDGREHARHFARKGDAERWLANIQSDIARGGYRDPAAARTTFKEYAEKWRAQQPHRPGTARLYERTLRLHVYPVMGVRQLGALRWSDIQGLVAGLVSRDYKPKTIENVVRLIRAVLNAAVDDGIIATSPHRKVTRPAVEHRHVVPLPLDGVRRAADAISPRMRALVLLSVGTGLRQGEALGLTVDRVNLLRREVTVDRQLIKVVGQPPALGSLKTTSSRRVVPLPTSVVDALAAHMAAYPPCRDGLIFSGADGQPVARAWLHRTWRKAITDAGLPADTTWHLLRHTYASVLIDGGESATVVARRLGHANPSETLRTYSHLWPDSDERTRQVVDSAFAKRASTDGEPECGTVIDPEYRS
jgi:integrase